MATGTPRVLVPGCPVMVCPGAPLGQAAGESPRGFSPAPEMNSTDQAGPCSPSLAFVLIFTKVLKYTTIVKELIYQF